MQDEMKVVNNANTQAEKEEKGIIDMFEIPEELAKELSDNLIKQTIRQNVLKELVGDQAKFEETEKMLMPIVAKVEALKVVITRIYVPEKYKSEEYIWNYDGYELDGNKVQILRV